MRNFLQIAGAVDVGPVLNAMAQNPDLWDENTLRTTHEGSAHASVSDIWVWFNRIDPEAPERAINDLDVIPYRAWSALPQIRVLIYDLMRRVEGIRLGRVVITRLPPGKMITPHVDTGAPAELYSRYHVSLWSRPGCVFHAGAEAVQMPTGSVWWFDNQQIHSVVNNSDDDRLTLIVDILTA